jgi:hypothetical protein
MEVAAVNRYPDDTSLIELARHHGSLRSLSGQLGVSRVSLTNYLLRRPALDRAVRVVLTSRARPVELAAPSQDKRDKAAKSKHALPDGSFPINTVGDLQNAISAYGRAKPEHKAKVRALIRKRARALKRPDLIPEAWGKPGITLANTDSRAYPKLERVPGKQNWVDKAGGLPSYIERIAKHLHYEQGMPISRAIAVAVNTVKRWAAGGGVAEHGSSQHVSAKTRALASAALAEWEAKKAHAHANPDLPGSQGVLLLATYSAQELNQVYQAQPAKKGTKKSGTATAAGAKKKVVRTQQGAARYHVPVGSEIGSARNANAAKAQQDQGAMDQYKGTVSAKDRDAKVKALNDNDLGRLSQVAFSFKSSNPDVVALRNSVVGQLRARGLDPAKYGYLGGAAKSTAGKVVAKAPVRKPAAKKPTPATKKPIPKDPKALGPHKSYPGAVRVR